LILISSWGRGFVSFASGVLHFNFLHYPEESGLHLYAFLWGGDLRSKLNCCCTFVIPAQNLRQLMEYGMPKKQIKIRKYKIMTIVIIVRRLAKPTQATALF
jgi:hypothetical protein